MANSFKEKENMKESCYFVLQSCELLIMLNDHILYQKIVSKESSSILQKGFVHLDDLPKRWYEIQGLEKISNSYLGTRKDVIDHLTNIVPKFFAMTDGYPLVWQCSRGHARFYKKLMDRSKNYKLSFISGSLAGKKPIIDWSQMTGGGSDDEQIVMLEMLSSPD